MIRRSLSLAGALLLGVSGHALAQSQAVEPPYCGDDTGRPCGPLPDDGRVETRRPGPNLEQGQAADVPFRVSVDGDPAGGLADRQRAQDLALDAARVDVQATTLQGAPTLSVVPGKPVYAAGETVRFHLLSNYTAFIDRAELRLFEADQNLGGAPLTVLPVRFGETAAWSPDPNGARALRVVLRVYDAEGRFDETAPQPLGLSDSTVASSQAPREGPLFENQRTLANIPVSGAEITVSGQTRDPGARVAFLGAAVPVDREGRFVAQQIVPTATREIVVEVADGDEVKTLRRELVLPTADRFFVGIADFTVGTRGFDDAKRDLLGDDGDYREDYFDGRLAFYYKGQVNPRWRITASADTGEQPIEDLFTNFDAKDPRSLLRRLDPDLHYPVYGDDSTLVEDAPTYGKFYLRGESENALAMWGNFHTQLSGSELIRYQRGLYGANLGWRSSAVTELGERRTEVNAFAADPGTLASREEFASTGGSVYYLRNQDLSQGSERLFAEVRDRDSGLVLERQELLPGRDYEVNYLQGRILLRQALPITADGSLFVRESSLAGNPVWLVTTYEYVAGLTEIDAFTSGGRAQHWLGDHLRVGVTGYHQGQDQSEQDLYGADVLLRYKPGTYLRAELAQADGAGEGTLFSSTGGYDFTRLQPVADQAGAVLVEGAVDLAEVTQTRSGRLGGYWRTREAGFSAPGELTFNETLDQFGGTADVELRPGLRLKGKADVVDGALTDRHAVELGLERETVSGWHGGLGVRSDKQQGQAGAYSPIQTDPAMTGTRTDAALTVGYRNDPGETERAWSVFGFGQLTVDHDPGRLSNDRFGLGGAYPVNDRITVKGEVSDGDLGFGADARADYAVADGGSLFLSYALAGENPDAFTNGRLGRLTAGTRRRLGESASLFAEGRYEHGSGPTGWTQAYGADFTPFERWTFGARYETGELADALGQGIERRAIGATADYGGESVRVASALEQRTEKSVQFGDRTTWAARNLVTWKVDPALRLFAKANLSLSEADQSSLLDADYYEVALAGAYRPVDNDRLNLLAKYTYLYDLPSPGQVDSLGLNLDYAQRSHVAAIDGTYQLFPRLAVGAKVAYRVGELRASRDASAPWFDSQAVFWALRADYRVVRAWDVMAEVRELRIREASDSRLGGVVAVYRHFGEHLKAGVGYNFTDYSDDLTDLSYDDRGLFLNLIGKF
jgi:hypothetical protein